MCVVIWMPTGAPILADDIVGRTAYRLISSRFPTITLFEDLLDPGELELAFELESLTNDRLLDHVGHIALVPPNERMVGPGSSVVMAAFTHIGVPSRFTRGEYGVFYAGLSLITAIEEARHSQACFLAATEQPPFELTMRSYITQVDQPLLDVRGAEYSDLHVPDEWGRPQQFARQARAAGENGLWYRSVRHLGGECIAAFRPKVVQPATQAKHYRFVWNGAAITDVLEVQSVRI